MSLISIITCFLYLLNYGVYFTKQILVMPWTINIIARLQEILDAVPFNLILFCLHNISFNTMDNLV